MGKTLDQHQKNPTQKILEPHKRELLSHAKISFGLGQFIIKFAIPHQIPCRTQERKKNMQFSLCAIWEIFIEKGIVRYYFIVEWNVLYCVDHVGLMVIFVSQKLVDHSHGSNL